MATVRLKLFCPRKSEREILESPARFKIACCGRRWGKTLTALNWLLKAAWENPGTENWWVAPIYRQAKIPWRRMLRAIPKDAIKEFSKSELRIELLSGGIIQFLSTDNFENLRGEGIAHLVMDEASRCPRESWEEVLRPSLSDTQGKALFISTPKGRNWIYEMWTRGQDRIAWPDYQSWSFPTADNPKIGTEEIEQARQILPTDVFSQEYLAQFLEGHAGVFRKIDQCICGSLQGPVPREIYWMGVDLAKHQDFTVICILDNSGHLVYFDRFNQIDWPFQKGMIYQRAIEYNAKVLIDATGIGDPIFDDLVKMNLSVQAYKFSHESKKALIESLIVAMENHQIVFPNIPVLVNELRTFEYEMSKSGVLRYSAPVGFHDDTVIALALANWLRQNAAIVWEAPYETDERFIVPDNRRDFSGFAVQPPSARRSHWETE